MIFGLATVAGMKLFTALTLVGLELLRQAVLKRYESGISGGLLCPLGVIVIVLNPRPQAASTARPAAFHSGNPSSSRRARKPWRRSAATASNDSTQ